jgi:hypothetical protein
MKSVLSFGEKICHIFQIISWDRHKAQAYKYTYDETTSLSLKKIRDSSRQIFYDTEI